LRFPTDEPQPLGALLEAVAPITFVVLAALFTYQDLSYTLNSAPSEDFRRLVFFAGIALEQAVLISGSVVLLVRCFTARGLEREKLRWIIAGVIATSAGYFMSALDQFTVLNLSPAAGDLLDLPYVGLPLAVAYTVLHHRVISVRFVASRAIVLGIIAGAVGLMIVALDWFSSTRMPNSRLQLAVYVGFALIVGLLLNPAWTYVTKTIDAISFKHWQRVQQLAASVGGEMRQATSTGDLYDPLTRGIADAFSLTSAALFERLEDGGFVRVAAFGWPRGALWHLLPGDPLNDAMAFRGSAKTIDAKRWGDGRLPSGAACPTIAVPVLVGRTVAGILLFGAHENGAAIDPDEVRLIRSLASECAPLYTHPHEFRELRAVPSA